MPMSVVSENHYYNGFFSLLFRSLFLILYLLTKNSLFQNTNPRQASSRADLSSLCAHLLRTLESRQSEAPGHSLTHILPVLNSILTHSPECLTEGMLANTVFLLKKKICHWLEVKGEVKTPLQCIQICQRFTQGTLSLLQIT